MSVGNASSRRLKRGESEGLSMRLPALALACVLLTAGLAGCLGGDEADASQTGQDDLDENSRPSDGSGEDSADDEDADDSGETEDEESSEGEDSQEDSDAASGDPEAADEGPRVDVAWFNGSVRGQSAPMLGPFCVETCDNQFQVELDGNETALLAEIAWEAEASIMFDLDIPYEECGAGIGEDCPPASTAGDGGYLAIRVTQASDIVAGNWTASAWAEDSPTEAVGFTIAVSLFASDIPNGYGELAE